MSYKLRSEERLGDGLRRISCEQIEAALHASTTEGNGKNSPVHETRKHLKKARAALRLVAHEVDPDLFKKETHRLRDAARLVSEIRDAEVRLQTVKQLRELVQGKKRAANFREAEELLAFELDSFQAAFSDWGQEARVKLSTAQERIAQWSLADLSCKQIRRIVQKSYKRGRRALRRAIEKPRPKNFHAFRKRAKELWYQMRIIEPLHPAIFKELSDHLKTLGQHLGQAHDLAFLNERLSTIVSGNRGRRILSGLIDGRRKELQRISVALGKRFYAEPARVFSARISKYFDEWEVVRQRCPQVRVLKKAA